MPQTYSTELAGIASTPVVKPTALVRVSSVSALPLLWLHKLLVLVTKLSWLKYQPDIPSLMA